MLSAASEAQDQGIKIRDHKAIATLVEADDSPVAQREHARTTQGSSGEGPKKHLRYTDRHRVTLPGKRDALCTSFL